MGIDITGILFYGFVQKDEDETQWDGAYDTFMENYDFHFKEKTGLDFGRHCSSNEPLHYLSIAEATFEADADMVGLSYPLSIDPMMLAIRDEWKERLLDYAARKHPDLYFEVLKQQEPQWYLVCYSG